MHRKVVSFVRLNRVADVVYRIKITIDNEFMQVFKIEEAVWPLKILICDQIDCPQTPEGPCN